MPQPAADRFVADPFLATEGDCPVFGFNLACAYPYPAEIAEGYQRLSVGLGALDGGLYVYPAWETHVTIVTFANFSRHRHPSPELIACLEALIPRVSKLIQRLPLPNQFELTLKAPLLTPKAIILPIEDQAQAIPSLRDNIRAAMGSDPLLQNELEHAGWNIPGIIHSTIARFAAIPANRRQFIEDFDRLASAIQPMRLNIDELLLTTETKPYMRTGEILRCFPLGQKV